MTPDQLQRFERIEALMARFVSDHYTFSQHIQMFDGRNIQLGKTTGTKIGTETTQKLGFFNATPVSQQASIADPVGGGTVDSQARTAINSILDVLDIFGFTA